MVLNAIIPGLGSLFCGRSSGLPMLLLFCAAILMFFFLPGWSKLLAILPALVSYIWSISAGVQLLSEKERGPGVPE
ncbi:MAG: hypothetical protein V1754_05990, partial [Pseudomonadota bacterium]